MKQFFWTIADQLVGRLVLDGFRKDIGTEASLLKIATVPVNVLKPDGINLTALTKISFLGFGVMYWYDKVALRKMAEKILWIMRWYAGPW